jgi:hypothetical protein
MPTVNLYYIKKEHEPQITDAIKPMKVYIAQKLTCGDISLTPEEVSIRVVYIALSKGMIADIEMDITAASFQERVDKQDEICLDVQAFTKTRVPDADDVKVWLNLHELGHSFE